LEVLVCFTIAPSVEGVLRFGIETFKSLERLSMQEQILLLDTLLVADNDELARLMSDLECQMSSDLNLRSQMFIHA